MYRIVFLECKDGKHLTRQNGPWHPDFAVSKRWYDYWAAHGHPLNMLRMEHISVSDDGKSTVTTVDPNVPPGGGSKGGGADADLLAALSSMA